MCVIIQAAQYTEGRLNQRFIHNVHRQQGCLKRSSRYKRARLFGKHDVIDIDIILHIPYFI